MQDSTTLKVVTLNLAHGRKNAWHQALLKRAKILANLDEVVRILQHEQPDIVVVGEAGDGAGAVEAVLRLQPDVALLDVRMPVLNGIDATKAIKSSNHHIPIIAQTAYAQPSEKDHYIGVGCDDFIPKPINSKHFMSVLERFLNAN